MNEQQLLKLKEDVDNAKSTVSELKGQLTALMKQLLDNWNCKNIAEAQTKLSEMEKDIKILENKIEKGVEELEENYNVEK